MRAGELRHKITIQVKTETQSSSGAVTETWATFAEVWSKYKPLSGSELFKMDQEVAEGRARFIMRYLAGVTTKMRIVYNSRNFDIESVIDIKGRRRSMELLGVEVAV